MIAEILGPVLSAYETSARTHESHPSHELQNVRTSRQIRGRVDIIWLYHLGILCILCCSAFSAWRTYNLATTGQFVICQFNKNVHFINSVISASYRKHEICKHFQCLMLKSYCRSLKVKNVATEILMFDLKLFIGVRHCPHTRTTKKLTSELRQYGIISSGFTRTGDCV